MAYLQHTKCIDIAKFQPLKYKAQPAIEMLALFGGTLAWVAALLPIALGNPLCALHAIPLMLYGGVFGYCNWWLYHRLVCNGGDYCAFGRVLSVEPPGDKDWPDSYDTDYSVNLLLPGTELGVKQPAAEASTPFGKLVAPTAAVEARPDIDFSGESAVPASEKDKPNSPLRSAILHAEFEGSGVWYMFLASAASLMLVVAAIFVCQVPVVGWIASALLELLAFLALLFGHLAASNDGGSPTDINPNLGGLHPVDGNNPNTGDDILYVEGTWVFDGGHQDEDHGWNEIHPIKNALIVGHWKGNWSESVHIDRPLQEHCERITAALGVAQSQSTRDAQQNPENRWQWHPLIDGCEPRESEPPPIH